MLKQLDLLEKQIADIEHIIAAQFAQFNTKFTTIPEIGAKLISQNRLTNRYILCFNLLTFYSRSPHE